MLSKKHRIAASTLLAAVAMIAMRTAQAAPVDALAGEAQTTSCARSQVRVDYDVAYTAAAGGYAVTAANVTGLDGGCTGADLTVTLTGTGGVALTELSARVDATELVIPVVDVVAAQDVTGVSVVVAG